jgi:hypothetical protein
MVFNCKQLIAKPAATKSLSQKDPHAKKRKKRKPLRKTVRETRTAFCFRKRLSNWLLLSTSLHNQNHTADNLNLDVPSFSTRKGEREKSS